MKYPTCHLAQQGSNYERESWHVVVLCIHDQYLHTNSLTMCHVGIGRPANAERGREKQLLTVTQTVKTWQAEREWEQKQRNAYSKQECARRGKHSRRMSTRNREILVQAYWVGEGLRQGCWVGGKEPVHRCTRVHKCTERAPRDLWLAHGGEAVHCFHVTQQREEAFLANPLFEVL